MVLAGLLLRAYTNRRELVIIHGAARGADSIAGEIARELRVQVKEYPAQWQKHGKKAGPLRNIRMLQEGEPQLVIAFHDDLANSKGTRHMATIASKQGLEVFVVSRYSGG